MILVVERSNMDIVILDCPICGLPAELVGKFVIATETESVEYTKVACVQGHEFTPVTRWTTSYSDSSIAEITTYEQ